MSNATTETRPLMPNYEIEHWLRERFDPDLDYPIKTIETLAEELANLFFDGEPNYDQAELINSALELPEGSQIDGVRS